MARSGDKKEDRFNGVLLVHTTQPEAAQRVIEELLQRQARRWRLAEIVPAEAGRSTLERSEEHTSELQSRLHLVCRLLLEKKKKNIRRISYLMMYEKHLYT